MTKQRAEQLIVISLLVLLASTIGARLHEKNAKGNAVKDYGRKIVDGFFAIFVTSMIAEFAPSVGALFAIALASAAFFKDGLPLVTHQAKPEKQPNLKNPREKLPATPGPEVSPEKLGEQTI